MRRYRRLAASRDGRDVRLTSFEPRRRASSSAAWLSDSPTPWPRAALVDDDVLDPRLEARGDQVERQRQAADDRAVERRQEQHAVRVADDRLETIRPGRRRRGRQLRDQPVERLHELVVDGLGNRDLGSHSDRTLSDRASLGLVIIADADLQSVTPAAFADGTGWDPKPQGLCRGEVCVPAPGAIRDDGTSTSPSLPNDSGCRCSTTRATASRSSGRDRRPVTRCPRRQPPTLSSSTEPATRSGSRRCAAAR